MEGSTRAASHARRSMPLLALVLVLEADQSLKRGFASNSPNGRSTTSSTLLPALVHGTGRSNSPASTSGTFGGGGSGSLTPSASISDRTSVNAVVGDDVSVRANRPSAATSLRRRRQRAFHLTWARSHADAVELVQQFMGYLGPILGARWT